jgi:hypothetical protein
MELFGMSILETDLENNLLYCLTPYTEKAGEELQLTFPPRFVVDLAQLGQDAGITAFRENKSDSKNGVRYLFFC